MSLLDQLLDELAAESTSLERLVAGLDDEQWLLVTPARPWTIADTIAHLLSTDRLSVLACTSADEFHDHAGSWLAAVVDGDDADPVGDAARDVAARFATPAELLDGWREARGALADALRAVPEGTRLPWFGTTMTAPSMATARLMETWAHGHDVAHVLGVSRPPTDRLRHVARLAVRARPYAYAVRGRDLPDADVRVELTGPDGDTWSFGPEGAAERIAGSAHDFCLVAVQRLHPDDTDLEADGAAAAEWLGILQAFAGPPGRGRRPGEGHR